MVSVHSRNGSASNGSYHSNPNPQRKNQQMGVMFAGLFILLVIIAVSVTIAKVVSDPSPSEVKFTGAPFGGSSPVTAPISAPIATESPTNAPTTPGYQACNGYESLCDFPVNNALFATLHNAIASTEDGFVIFPNQALKLETALESGWRGLNFDIGKCSEYTDQPVRLVHGVCSLGTRDPIEVFSNILTFLQDNPNEVLLMPLQIDNSLDGGAITFNEIYAVLQQVNGLTSSLYQHPGVGTPWPTLRELIAAGTRILLFFYNGDTSCAELSDCPLGFHDWFTYAGETAFEFSSAEEIQDTASACLITRGSQGARDFFGINIFTELPSSDTSEIVNAADFVQAHLDNCTQFNAPLQPSLILVDFWNIGNVQSVVSTYNGRLANTTMTATVAMNIEGSFTTTMNETEQLAFLSSCSNFYAAQFTELTNVYCTDVLNESLISRRRMNQQIYRRLQTSSVLQVTVQVKGDNPSSTTSTSITTTSLGSAIDAASDVFVQSLSVQNEYFSTVTAITTVTR
jgi:hypothetical protein